MIQLVPGTTGQTMALSSNEEDTIGCSGPVHWDDPEGREGEGGFTMGTHVHLWLIHVNVWQEPLQYCKIISLKLKLINLQKKRRHRISPGRGGALGTG